MQAKLVALVLATACMASACHGLPAEVASGGVRVSKTAGQSGAGTTATPAPALPADACALDGFWSFFDAYVRSPMIRETHTDVSAHGAISPFRIALSDNQWVYVDGQATSPRQRLDLVEVRDGESIRLDYAVASFGQDDEIISRQGPSGGYVFRFVDRCWRLVE